MRYIFLVVFLPFLLGAAPPKGPEVRDSLGRDQSYKLKYPGENRDKLGRDLTYKFKYPGENRDKLGRSLDWKKDNNIIAKPLSSPGKSNAAKTAPNSYSNQTRKLPKIDNSSSPPKKKLSKQEINEKYPLGSQGRQPREPREARDETGKWTATETRSGYIMKDGSGAVKGYVKRTKKGLNVYDENHKLKKHLPGAKKIQ